MKNIKRSFIPYLVIIVCILLLGGCFAASIVIVENYAKHDCFDSIEEVTDQVSNMFVHTLSQSNYQLELFADILAANSENPDDLLRLYMENFCDTQSFAAVCLHRADDSAFSHGYHPHNEQAASFAEEREKVPYISDVIRAGEYRSQQFVYLATPVVRNGQTVAILYGYISLDTFPSFVSSTAYDGKGQFYIVDGNTGDFLMDEYHRYGTEDDQEIPLSNCFDGSLGDRETKPGYTAEAMNNGIRNGDSGYYIFKSQRTGQWYYTYYMPMGINNWSMQMTIDEPTAFETYYAVRDIVFVLMMSVLVLCAVIIAVLVLLARIRTKQDKKDLHRADYLNEVQSALLTAHNNPDFVSRALKLVAQELKGEKAILLTFSGHIIHNIYYWPSLDMNRAKILIGVNIREEFPTMFDALSAGESFFCDEELIETRFTPKAKALFHALAVHNIVLVPITDPAGILKGAIAVLNMNGEVRSVDMIECVTRDFFMAITNLEKHNIIKKMATVDYMTGIKNRNSFEAELASYETVKAESLWCVYVDVNGLHEMNNTKGHSAGDEMLRTVALAMKKIFGEECSYRMGGDEFIAFCTDSTHEDFMSYKYRLLDELGRKGYSVSVGFAMIGRNENNIFDVASVVAKAEAIMYQKKQECYKAQGGSNGRVCGPVRDH